MPLDSFVLLDLCAFGESRPEDNDCGKYLLQPHVQIRGTSLFLAYSVGTPEFSSICSR